MKDIFKKLTFYAVFLCTGYLFSHSSALAGLFGPATVTHGLANGTTLTSPNTVWIKLQGEGVIAITEGFYVHNSPNGGSYIKTTVQVKAHCPEDYEVVKNTLGRKGQHFANDAEHNRTETITYNDNNLWFIDDLLSRCSGININGQGSFEHKIFKPAETECARNKNNSLLTTAKLDFTLEDPRKKYSDELDWTLQVECENVLPMNMTYARVNNALEYSCPHTSKENEAFWLNFRMVVEGTYSYKVIAKEDLGTPRCIRIRESDGSNVAQLFSSSND